jgi:hypothetical protein
VLHVSTIQNVLYVPLIELKDLKIKDAHAQKDNTNTKMLVLNVTCNVKLVKLHQEIV